MYKVVAVLVGLMGASGALGEEVEPTLEEAFKAGRTAGEHEVIDLIQDYCEKDAEFTVSVNGKEIKYLCFRKDTLRDA